MLCRICGALLTGYKYSVAENAVVLHDIFKSDFEGDVDVLPPSICGKCHAFIGNFKREGCIPTIKPVTWKHHINDDCPTCNLREQKGKGGRPKKGKREGSAKQVVTVDDIMKLDGDKPIPPAVQKAISHVLNIKVYEVLMVAAPLK